MLMPSLTDFKSIIILISFAGTFAYAAPEAILGDKCGLPADIYSFGVVLLEVLPCCTCMYA